MLDSSRYGKVRDERHPELVHFSLFYNDRGQTGTQPVPAISQKYAT